MCHKEDIYEEQYIGAPTGSRARDSEAGASLGPEYPWRSLADVASKRSVMITGHCYVAQGGYIHGEQYIGAPPGSRARDSQASASLGPYPWRSPADVTSNRSVIKTGHCDVSQGGHIHGEQYIGAPIGN